MIESKILEEKVLYYCLTDREAISSLCNLDAANFTPGVYRDLFVGATQFYRKYHHIPSIDSLLLFLQSQKELSVEYKQKLINVYNSLMELSLEKQDIQFIIDLAEKLELSNRVRNSIVEAGTFLESGKLQDAYKALTKPLHHKSLASGNITELVGSLDERIQQRKVHHFVPISTGYEKLDSYLRGGLGRGELGIILGATNSGKSMFLVNLGVNALKGGFRVLYFTLELSSFKTYSRIESRLSGIPIHKLVENSEVIKQKICDIKDKIFVAEYPTKGTNVHELGYVLEHFEIKQKPIDLVLLDYADLFKLRGESLRLELAEVFYTLRGIAQKFNCALWTPTQANRPGHQSNRIKEEHISECIDKIFAADVVLSINQTVNEYPHFCRIFGVKVRDSEKWFEIPFRCDFTRALMLERQLDSLPEQDKKQLLGMISELQEVYRNGN